MTNTIRQSYASIQRNAPLEAPIVLLRIDKSQTTVAYGRGTELEQMLILDVGSVRTSSAFFKHRPPSPLELENAIMVVEDEVTRARAAAVVGARLYSTDELIIDMVKILGGSMAATSSLTIEQVEALFDQLAARSEGRPSSQVDIPDEPAFAATLLIVREFMHHLHFESIQLMVA